MLMGGLVRGDFGILDLELRILDFGFWISNLGFRNFYFAFLIWNCGFGILDFEF